MIALGIATAWLTLTAAGFAGLSALRGVVAREDVATEHEPLEGFSLRDHSLMLASTNVCAELPQALLG